MATLLLAEVHGAKLNDATAKALTAAYTSMDLPLMTVELPRSAMGVMMPSGA